MMLFLFIMLLMTASHAAKLDHTYLPPSGAYNSGGSPGAIQTPVIIGPFNGPALSETFNNYHQAPTSFGKASNPTIEYSGHSINIGTPTSSDQFSHSRLTNPGSISPIDTFSSISIGSSGISMPSPSSFIYNSPSNRPTATYGVPTSSQVTTERPQAAQERNSAIIHQHNDISADGFSYAFETENGISAEERGVATNGVQAQGAFSYTADDGNKYSITYTADENGYMPQGEHLPTSPPIPDVILRSLETIARAKANGISYEDGDDDTKQNNRLIQQYNTRIQNYDGTSYSNNGPVEQTNVPTYQTSLPIDRSNTPQQYGKHAQPNEIVQDYHTPYSMYVSAEFTDRHHTNNGPAYQTAPSQHLRSSPNRQFTPAAQSQNIAHEQNALFSQHQSGPYKYDAPSQQYKAAQSNRFDTTDQKFTPTQYYNGPVRGDNQGVRSDSTPNKIYTTPTRTNGPVQSYNRAPGQNFSPAHQTLSQAPLSNSPIQQYTAQAPSIEGPVSNPAQVHRSSIATQLNGAPTYRNYGPTQFNNVGSHQTPAEYSNTPVQQYNANQGPAQQYNHAPIPAQHFSTSSPQHGSLSQSNNGPTRSDSGYHQNKAPIYETSSQANRYIAPNQQYDTYPQSEIRPATQKNGLASISQEASRDQFSAIRAPASFSPKTGYKY